MKAADVLWLILFAAIAAGVEAHSKRRYGFWLTPVSVFIGVNCVSLCLYHLRLLGLKDVSLTAHVLVLAAMLMFAWGSGIASAMEAEKNPASHGRFSPGELRHLDTFFYVTVVLATLGWMTEAAILVARIGLRSLLANIWVLQTEFQMQAIGYLNVIGILVLPTYVIRRLSGRHRILDLVLVVSSVFGLLLAGIKSYLVYSSLAALSVWSVVLPQTFRKRNLVAAMLVLLGFFIVYTQYIDIFVADLYVGDGFFARLTPLHRPYIYLTGPWPAMENILEGDVAPPAMFGSIVLQPLWKILGDGLGLIEPVPAALPFTDIGTSLFNVYSFFGEVYWDWGWPGVLALSTLLGLVSTRLYLRARRHTYWGNSLVYGVFNYGVFLTLFNYRFEFKMMLMLLYVYALGFVLLRGGVFVDQRTNAR